MVAPLNILILEDNPSDAKLMLHALGRVGYETTSNVVDTEQGFRKCLKLRPEVILSDFSMPEFDALRALEILQAGRRGIPFIVVSETSLASSP